MRPRMLRRNVRRGAAGQSQQGLAAVHTACRNPMAFRRMSK
jgi:hypothetical protein